MLDYIDCISNEGVPFEIPESNSKENLDSRKVHEKPLDEIEISNDGKEKGEKHPVKGRALKRFQVIRKCDDYN